MSFPSARRPPHDALQKNPFDAAVIRLCDILGYPVFSEHMSGDLDDDIVGLHAGIVTVMTGEEFYSDASIPTSTFRP